MVKGLEVLRCPVCRVEVKASRLDVHMQKVHPRGESRPKKGGRRAPAGSGSNWIPATAIIAVVVIAAVGIYYLNLPEPEEMGNGPENPPVSTGVYPTQYAYLEVASRGTIVIGLYGNETPNTVQNFIDLVSQSFFVGTIFHRIVPDFMIQGGGFTPDLDLKPVPAPPIKLEISPKLHNTQYTVAMARTNDPDSATTQFFINLVDNTGKLDPGGESGPYGYAVFGTVVRGREVVDNIANTPCEYGSGGDAVPTQPIVEERGTLIITNTRLMSTPDG